MRIEWSGVVVAAGGLLILGAALLFTPKRSPSVRHPARVASAPAPSPVLPDSGPPPRATVTRPPATPREEPRVETAPEEVADSEFAATAEFAEFRGLLELSEPIASRIVRLLGQRDEEAERILEIYGGSLSSEAIVTVRPRLRMLDAETDRTIEAILTPEQQGRYRKMRSEGAIAGTVLDVPPAVSPEEAHDEE